MSFVYVLSMNIKFLNSDRQISRTRPSRRLSQFFCFFILIIFSELSLIYLQISKRDETIDEQKKICDIFSCRQSVSQSSL